MDHITYPPWGLYNFFIHIITLPQLANIIIKKLKPKATFNLLPVHAARDAVGDVGV